MLQATVYRGGYQRFAPYWPAYCWGLDYFLQFFHITTGTWWISWQHSVCSATRVPQCSQNNVWQGVVFLPRLTMFFFVTTAVQSVSRQFRQAWCFVLFVVAVFFSFWTVLLFNGSNPPPHCSVVLKRLDELCAVQSCLQCSYSGYWPRKKCTWEICYHEILIMIFQALFWTKYFLVTFVLMYLFTSPSFYFV
jgi:hypothetical protein